MTSRAAALIERRQREADARAQARIARRRSLVEILLVGALTMPVIALVVAADRRTDVVVLDASHITQIAPAATAPAATVAEAATIHAPATTAMTAPPAPPAVRRLARTHGGSAQSRWVALECGKVADLVRAHGMPEWMTTVAWRESRCKHGVKNFDRSTADRSYGLFQINVLGDLWEESRDRCGLETPEELLDPNVNVSCAAALYRAYGYQPWDSGRYFDR